MTVLTKKLEKAGTYKFESVDGVNTSPTLAYVSADVANMGVLDDVYFKAKIDLAEKTLALHVVPRYNSMLEGFDIADVMSRIMDNINEDTLFVSHSSGEGQVLMVHTPLQSHLKFAGDSPLGRAALLAAEMPNDLGCEMPELESDDVSPVDTLSIDG